MDYSEMLFAFKVRELALKRLLIDAEKQNINQTEFMQNPGIAPYIQDVVHELRNISIMIRNVP